MLQFDESALRQQLLAGTEDDEIDNESLRIAEVTWQRGRHRLQQRMLAGGVGICVLALAGGAAVLSHGGAKAAEKTGSASSSQSLEGESCPQQSAAAKPSVTVDARTAALSALARTLLPRNAALEEASTVAGCEPNAAGEWRAVDGSSSTVLYYPGKAYDYGWSLRLTSYRGAVGSVGVAPSGTLADSSNGPVTPGTFPNAKYWVSTQTVTLKVDSSGNSPGVATVIDAQAVSLDGSRSAEIYAIDTAIPNDPGFATDTVEATLARAIG